MAIPLAFFIVIIIWSTTPLAIHWSGDEVSFLFGLAARMVIGLSVLLILHLLLRKPLVFTKQALHVYLAGGLGLFFAMTAVYSAARFIPTGWISVLFGLTPIVTSFMSAYWLNEQAFTRMKVTGKVLGILGLAVIFLSNNTHGEFTIAGIFLILFSVIIHSMSGVWVKRLNPGIDGMMVTTGSILVATPLYLTTWFIFDGVWPAEIPVKAATAIVYLGIAGSVIGFILYFYLLQKVTAHQVSLITLMTPVVALWLGYTFNDETISVTVYIGTGLILSGLIAHEFGGRIMVKIRTAP